jgi:preprotein translocase subunit SecD
MSSLGRAGRTILVSDTVSFLAAALLYYFAIGSVRGFAFTLGLTTIIDVLVVFTFTKPVMTLLARDEVLRAGAPAVRAGRPAARRPAPWRAAPRAAARVPARDHPGEGGVMSALGGIGGRTAPSPQKLS